LTVVVVGAGIVGAAVTYELARAGAEVVLLDKALPASGVTGVSFAWIGGPRGGDAADGSTPLRHRVLREYRRLEAEVPGVRVRWCGAMVWRNEEVPALAQLLPHERLIGPPGVLQLEPQLAKPPSEAVYLESDGAVDPVAVTQALVRAARSHGARLLATCAVTGLRVERGRVTGVVTSDGFLPATTVVIAAGADTPVLCALLGLDVPIRPSPALLLRFAAPPGLVRTLVATPDLEVREASPGRLLAAAAYQGEVDERELLRAGERIRSCLMATFHQMKGLRLDSVHVGARPMPVDGLPVIGPVPGVDGAYLAVMHSGVTLAPAVGPLVASEVVNGVQADELAGLRPHRFHR
jgi:glycine/D-amino acid oxidase-like deaminating enzyme